MTTNEEVHAAARDIATHLEGWHYDAAGSKNADGDLHWSAELTDGTYRVSISRKSYGADRGKLTIRAVLPSRDKRGGYCAPSGKTPEIGCGATRDAIGVARDIERRLLPDLKVAHAECLTRIGRDDAYADKRDAAIAALLAADIGASKPSARADARVNLVFPDSKDGTERYTYGDVQVHGDSCNLEIRGLTVEQVIAMVKIARGE